MSTIDGFSCKWRERLFRAMARIRPFLIGIGVVAGGLCIGALTFSWAMKKRFEPVPRQVSYPISSNQLEADRQDLDYLEELMHLDRSFSNASRMLFERERTALMQRSTPLTRARFQLAMDHLVALANNGHTSTLASQQAGRFPRAKVRFAWFGDDLYVVRAESGFEMLLGGRVLAIDGRDIVSATAATRPYVTGVDRYAKWYSLPLLESPQLLHEIWSDAEPGVLKLEVLTPKGLLSEFRVTCDAPHENPNKLVPIRDLAPAPIPGDIAGWGTILADDSKLPISLREPDRSLFVSTLSNQTLYVRINQVLPDSHGSLKWQLAELMQESGKRGWQRIILDLRFDTGGNYLQITDFTRNLHRALGRDGKLSILIGNMTFSAAIVTAARAKYFTAGRVELIGESVGDRDEYWAERG